MKDTIDPAATAAYNHTLQLGSYLSERSEDEGGWEHMFSKEDGLFIEDDVVRAQTAVMLENAKRWMTNMDEATLSLTTGGFKDHIFPIVRASFPNNPILDLVSVQPITQKNGTIFWLNYIIGRTRGQFARGDSLFDANVGWSGDIGYTDEQVVGESLGTSAAAAGQSFQVNETPVRAATVELTIAQGTGIVLRDDGNGGFNLIDDGGTGLTLSSGSINYVTGAISLTFSAALAGGDAATADYGTDAEGQDVQAEIDVEIASTGVQAIRRAIRTRISIESMQDFRQQFGQDINSTVVTGAAQAILADVGGEVVRDLWNMAGAAVSDFDITVPSGISRAEHFRDIRFPIEQANGAIQDATQRGEATWMVVDQGGANVLRTMGNAGGFEAAAVDARRQQGLVLIGTYDGLPVYRYKFMSAFPGASGTGNILLGYKGPDFFDAGYVHAPYQQFYTNGPDERADLTRRQAWAVRYAKKRINNNTDKRVTLSAS